MQILKGNTAPQVAVAAKTIILTNIGKMKNRTDLIRRVKDFRRVRPTREIHTALRATIMPKRITKSNTSTKEVIDSLKVSINLQRGKPETAIIGSRRRRRGMPILQEEVVPAASSKGGGQLSLIKVLRIRLET